MQCTPYMGVPAKQCDCNDSSEGGTQGGVREMCRSTASCAASLHACGLCNHVGSVEMLLALTTHERHAHADRQLNEREEWRSCADALLTGVTASIACPLDVTCIAHSLDRMSTGCHLHSSQPRSHVHWMSLHAFLAARKCLLTNIAHITWHTAARLCLTRSFADRFPQIFVRVCFAIALEAHHKSLLARVLHGTRLTLT
jgi:hypothetical protein